MKLKTLTTLCVVVLNSLNVITAKSDDENQLNISVVVPEQIEGLTAGQLSKLQSKMLRMVSNYGIAGEGFTDKFIMYPKYEIYDHKVVEGMQNVHVMEVEIHFIIKEVKTGKVYSVYTQEVTADGYSKKEAINQSISRLKTRGEKIETFLQTAKTKILTYYRENCNRLYNEASTMITQKRYSEAIALLYPVPKEVGGDCHKKIQRKLDEAYDGYLNKTCEKNLVRAKAEMSKNNNESALEILGSIESESNCHSSAQKLKAKIQVKTGQRKSADTSAASQIPEDNPPPQKEQSENTTQITDTPKSSTQKKPSGSQRRKKMGAIAKAEFTRTRHQGEIDRAIQEG